MLKNVLTILAGLLLGISIAYIFITYTPSSPTYSSNSVSVLPSSQAPQASNHEVLGFLPYWFLGTANADYSGKITTLDYFALSIDKDGTILKSTNGYELEPGFYALTSGKADPFFENAKRNNIKLSLTIFGGDQDVINQLISNPVVSADNLIADITPVINKYGFSDLNLDIESIGFASPSAQINYQSFVSEVHKQILAQNLNITLSDDIIPVDFIRPDHLSVPEKLAQFFDKVILMAYDFHSPSSFVTGPVAPLYGAGSVAEFDTEVAVNAALKNYDPSKILLGVPFYGYSWETLGNSPRSAVVPSSAYIESNKDIEDLLASCASCSASFDDTAQESYLIYKNDSGTYQQFFYPDLRSIESKINFVKGNNLGGLAIWALGYEATNSANPIFAPLQTFISNE